MPPSQTFTRCNNEHTFYICVFCNILSKIIRLFRLTNADKKKNNLLTTFKRNERDKKKLNDTILRQLRQLMNGDMQNTV